VLVNTQANRAIPLLRPRDFSSIFEQKKPRLGNVRALRAKIFDERVLFRHGIAALKAGDGGVSADTLVEHRR
jgi:hypothetical protein